MSIDTMADDSSMQRKIIEQLNKRLSYLTAGEVYTLAAILGETFWEDDDEDSHHALGRIFSALVSDGRLPFEANGWTTNRHNEYRYTPEE